MFNFFKNIVGSPTAKKCEWCIFSNGGSTGKYAPDDDIITNKAYCYLKAKEVGRNSLCSEFERGHNREYISTAFENGVNDIVNYHEDGYYTTCHNYWGRRVHSVYLPEIPNCAGIRAKIIKKDSGKVILIVSTFDSLGRKRRSEAKKTIFKIYRSGESVLMVEMHLSLKDKFIKVKEIFNELVGAN